MKKTSKTEVKGKVEDFFLKIKSKNSKDVKKIKTMAMSHNISLNEKRKTFCKYCLNPYINSKIRVKSGMKTIICEKCGKISRWKIK